MKKTSLVIMAAGIGSRYGVGIKQLEGVGMHDELIIDYSIHDAVKAGFNKIIFIIREDIKEDFKERIGDRIEEVCAKLGVETEYTFQRLEDIPEGCAIPEGRAKPWGTCQAVLAAKEKINEACLIINADDYYGKEAYSKMHDWLLEEHEEGVISMAGFILKNTLSDNGGVTRGVCTVSTDGKEICGVNETKNIIKTPQGAEANGVKLDENAYVSMNMWGLPAKGNSAPRFLKLIEEEFKAFFDNEVARDPLKAEYLLPNLIGGKLAAGECRVEVLETADKWFGVTYKEDKPAVVARFRELIENGEYLEYLYDDMN